MIVFFLVSAGRRSSDHSGEMLPAALAAAGLIRTVPLRSGLAMPAVGYGTCCRPSAKGGAVLKSTTIYLKNGGRLIDTAMAYRNHPQIGQALKQSGVPRSEIWITSKIAPNKAKGYEECLVAVDGILKELDTPYLDLILIHTPKLGKELTVELWRGLIEAKRLGKAKAIGVSNFNRGEIEDIAAATDGEMPEANEIQQHPWSTPAWRDLARWQREHGIATIAYTSLGGSKFHRAEGGGAVWPAAVARIARARGATEAQVLLMWAVQQGMAVIPGSGSPAHILENLRLPEVRLSEREISEIENAAAPGEWWDAKRGPVKYGDDEALRPWEPRKNG